MLVNYLKTLHCPGNLSQKETSSFMLSLLLKHFPTFIKPYARPVVTTIINTLQGNKAHSALTRHCIFSIGNLSAHAGRSLTEFTSDLMKIVIENFHDKKPSRKRGTALDTLGKLITCTGYSVDPLSIYPPLLDLLFEKIDSATASERKKLIRLVGIIGAVDPYRQKTLHLSQLESASKKRPAQSTAGSLNESTSSLNTDNNNNNNNVPNSAKLSEHASNDNNNNNNNLNIGMVTSNVSSNNVMSNHYPFADISSNKFMFKIKDKSQPDEDVGGPLQDSPIFKQFLSGLTSSSENYYPLVVLALLMRFLKNPHGPISHLLLEVVKDLMTILKSMGSRCLPFLDSFMIPLIEVMDKCGEANPKLCELMFNQLATLVIILKQHTRPYLPILKKLMMDYWIRNNTKIQNCIINLLEHISFVMLDEFASCLQEFMPRMLQSVQMKRSNSGIVLRAWRFFGVLLDPYLHMVIPATVELLSRADSNPAGMLMSLEAIKTITHMAHVNGIEEYAILVFTSLTRAMEVPELTTSALTACTSILCTLSSDSRRIIFLEMVYNTGLLLKEQFFSEDHNNNNNNLNNSSANPNNDNNSSTNPTTTSINSLTLSSNNIILQIPAKRASHDSRNNSPIPTTSITSILNIKNNENNNINIKHNDNNVNVNNGYNDNDNSPSMEDSALLRESGQVQLISDENWKKRFDEEWDIFMEVYYQIHAGKALTKVVPVSVAQDPLMEEDSEGDVAVGKPMQVEALMRVWELTQVCSEGDWAEWMQKVAHTFIRESPSTAIRCVTNLAMHHPPVALQLLHVSFLSCWDNLNHKQRLAMVKCIEKALSSSTIDPKILHILLDLAEFMERSEKAMPLDIEKLGNLAQSSCAFAKALYYFEKQYKESPRTNIAALITINDHLGDHEAANGFITVAQKEFGMDIDITWYEKVQKWVAGLAAYESMQAANPKDVALMLGRMRCLEHLGAWNRLFNLSEEALELLPTRDFSSQVACYAVEAAFNLGKFDAIEKHVGLLSTNTIKGNFYRAVIEVHKGNFERAKRHISHARSFLAPELTALLSESYSRAYSILIKSQQLSELEEMMQYQLLKEAGPEGEEMRNALKELWTKRLQLVEYSVDPWQSVLSGRSLVLPAEEFPTYWVKFANLLRKSERPRRAITILSSLVDWSDNYEADGITRQVALTCTPYIHYSYLKLFHCFTPNLAQWSHPSSSPTPSPASTPRYYSLTSSDPSDPISTTTTPSTTKATNTPTTSSTTTRTTNTPTTSTPTTTPPTPTNTPTTSAITIATSSAPAGAATLELSSSPSSTSSYASTSFFPSPCYPSIAYTAMLRWVDAFTRGEGSKVSNHQKARCYEKLALWKLQQCELDGKFLDSDIPTMVEHSRLATELKKDWQMAWHTYAIVHFRILNWYSKQKPNHKLFAHLLPAIQGFLWSISLTKSFQDSLQDTLGLLTLWFTYGYKKEVDKVVREGFERINVDTWLPVLPQIIARLHMKPITQSIEQLLASILKKHIQALVWPIVVATKSDARARKASALKIMNIMKQQNNRLLQDALLISNELMRFSILWKEKWKRGLDDAYHHYLERDMHNMMLVLLPLHDMCKPGAAVTPNEQLFLASFGKDLEKAWNCCQEYAKTRNESCLQLAWDLYAHVFRILQRQIQQSTESFEKLHLSHYSPELESVQNMVLCVPGTYTESYFAKEPMVTIKKFAPTVKVIPSKQRPRKLVIVGSNGQDYPFLLKGNEDLRQDARAMQLFELVNKVLSKNNPFTYKHLSIQLFSVTPLSNESGLIKWIPHSDTFHELLKVYREAHDIPIDIEMTHLQRFIPKEEYYKIPIMNKLEYFESTLEQTPGDDLAKIFWLNSKNAELWLDKRTTYTQSLAVMSMAGYVLGLGDRHPNNLMINRNSGQVIHIDFGDCFEVSMNRERFAERVPFRLTRMLVTAMGVTGVEGTFRHTCTHVMRVLRNNKESIKAILDAFVHDPLFNWGLNRDKDSAASTPDSSNNKLVSAMGTIFSGSVSSGDPLPPAPTLLSSHLGMAQANQPMGPGGAMDAVAQSVDTGNITALHVLERVEDKLTGRDFCKDKHFGVETQVDLLILQAQSNVNLCQAYLPWCPFW